MNKEEIKELWIEVKKDYPEAWVDIKNMWNENKKLKQENEKMKILLDKYYNDGDGNCGHINNEDFKYMEDYLGLNYL